MKTYMKLQTLLAAFALASTVSLEVDTVSATSLRGSSFSLQHEEFVMCRMLIFATMYAEGISKQESACIPIIDGKESDDIIPLSLPQDIASVYVAQLEQGTLLVTISDATLNMTEITTTATSKFTVVQQAPNYSRDLQCESDFTRTTGEMTVAVIRISTRDSRSTISDADIDAMFDKTGINFVTQYDLCSFGKLIFKKADRPTIDVTIDEPIANFQSDPTKLVGAAQLAVLKQLNIESMPLVADKVIICVPPGTGTWIASGGVNHWRTQFNDRWCTSLTANMHELGHNMGLLHANEGRKEYGDATGIMGFSYQQTNWPQRCFDGPSNRILGWYDEMEHDAVAATPGSSKLIKLAAIVNYDKADKKNQPVLVNLSDELFLQYNRATSFNVDTGEMQDTVTISRLLSTGESDLLAGLGPGTSFEQKDFMGSGKTLVIRACEAIVGNDKFPDAMITSVGLGQADCGAQQPEAPTQVPFQMPVATPTRDPVQQLSPTSPPTSGATSRPSPSPTTSAASSMPNPLSWAEDLVALIKPRPPRTPALPPTSSPSGVQTSVPKPLTTVSPTNPPTGCETSAPKPQPGLPTAAPSRVPTLSPTNPPTINETSVPNPLTWEEVELAMPTTAQPQAPTLSPTNPPTGGETSAPTPPTGDEIRLGMPTSTPTLVPTLSPTSPPTLSVPKPLTWTEVVLAMPSIATPSLTPTLLLSSPPSSTPTDDETTTSVPKPLTWDEVVLLTGPTTTATPSPTLAPTASPTSRPGDDVYGRRIVL
jgi:hypothetical protein